MFAPAEVAALAAEAEALRGEARTGDKLSWWGKSAGGEQVLCRVTRGATKPRLDSLRGDHRLLALTELADEPVVRAGPEHVMGSVYQNLGLKEPSARLLEQALDLRPSSCFRRNSPGLGSTPHANPIYIDTLQGRNRFESNVVG